MQDPVRIPLYEMEEAGSKYYRIPALIKIGIVSKDFESEKGRESFREL